MKSLKLIVGIGAAVGAVCLSAAGASAATVVTTFQGTILSGIDNLGLFGAPGANLAGDSYISVYTTNSETVGDTIVNNMPYDSYIFGGVIDGTISPTRELMTINSRSFSSDGIQYGEDLLTEYTHGGVSQIYLQAGVGNLNVVNEQIQSYSNFIGTDGDFRIPLSYTLQSGDFSYGIFRSSAPITNVGTNLTLMPTSVSVALIPEPASWAMTLVGFFGMGAMLRRARRLTVRVD